MYFDRNNNENKYGKENEGDYLSCVTNSVFYFSNFGFQILTISSIFGTSFTKLKCIYRLRGAQFLTLLLPY